MNKVNTVLGEVDVSELGFTLVHEHCYLGSWNNRIADPAWYDEKDGMEMITGVLRDARAHGVCTVVDCTTQNMGRDVRILQEASEKTGVHIIAASGCMMDVANWAQQISVENLTGMIVREITEGVQGTGIRCGVIKCGIEPAMDKVTEKMLIACGRAQVMTGAPIMTHCRPAGLELGLEQLDLFESEGVDLSKVVIGHYRNGDSLAYAEKIFQRGANLAIDQMNFNGHQFAHNMERIPELIRRGYTEKLFLSHDAVIVYNHSPWREYDHRSYINYAPDSWSHMMRVNIPALEERGVTKEQIHQIFYANPARLYQKKADARRSPGKTAAGSVREESR